MDLNKIKKMVQSSGGNWILVENGEPTLVVSKFEDYKRFLSGEEKLFSEEEEKEDSREDNQEDNLTIDDLPF